MGLEKHLRETENQVHRLEQVASSRNLSLKGPACKAMAGLLEEGEQMLALNASDEVLAAALLAAAQGIEHYEIAKYGTVVHFAKRLGYYPEAEIVQATLTEEKNTDEILNQLALKAVNEKALSWPGRATVQARLAGLPPACAHPLPDVAAGVFI